jgi:hypothetical protein
MPHEAHIHDGVVALAKQAKHVALAFYKILNELIFTSKNIQQVNIFVNPQTTSLQHKPTPSMMISTVNPSLLLYYFFCLYKSIFYCMIIICPTYCMGLLMDSIESAFRELQLQKCCQQLNDITRHPYQQLFKQLTSRKPIESTQWIERIRQIVTACSPEQYPLDAALGHLLLAMLLIRNKQEDIEWQAENEFASAIEILETSYHTPSTYHYLALTWWLRGCFYLERDTDISRTIQCWQNSQDLFKRLATSHYTLNPEYYRSIVHKQQTKITALFKQPINHTAPATTTPAAIPIQDATKSTDAILIQNKSIAIIGVYEDLRPSAGPPTEIIEIQVPNQKLRLPNTDFTEWKFKNHRWKLIGLPGRKGRRTSKRSIRLQRSQKYLIMRIRGDSMNQTGINDGDYVLVQLQDQANPGDIVVAQVIQGRSLGLVIKRFSLRPDGKSAELISESDKPIYQPITFSAQPESNEKIIGIVLGVFKSHSQSNIQ